MYGVDWEGPVPEEDIDPTVEIPYICQPLTPDQVQQLHLLYQQDRQASNYNGVHIYLDVLEFICTKQPQ